MLEPRGAAGEAESVEGLLLRVPARGGGAERGVAYNMLGMRVLAGEAARPAAGAGGGDAAAVAWFRRASAEGNGAAMHNLGVCIEDGRGAAADAGEARAWYRRAAAHGSAAGQNSLGFGLMCEGRHTEARAALELAVAQGNSDACFNLGSLLEHGAGGAPDAARAQQLYEAASAAGCPKAMHRLGNMLYSGVAGAGGDGASCARAFALFSRAAALGHAEAGNCAGLLLEAGEGVQADAARARDAYATAAARGSAAAAYNLAALHEKERDVPAALRALRRAEELGHPAAALDIERVRVCADERRAAEAPLNESCSAHSSASALDGVLPGADLPGADPGTL
jgi:TPR repeat protein